MKTNEGLVAFLQRKIKRLYIPFVLIEMFYLAINNSLYSMGIVSAPIIDHRLYTEKIRHIVLFDNISSLLAPTWFLVALFWSLLLSYLLIRFFDKWEQKQNVFFVFAVALIYLGLFLGNKGIDFSFFYNFAKAPTVIIQATGYMLLGFCFKRYLRKMEYKVRTLRIRNVTRRCFTFCVIITFIFLMIFERITRCNANMRDNSYDFVLIQPLLAFIGIIDVFCFSYYMSEILKKHIFFKSIILYISDHTFSIMCFHYSAFKLIGLVQVYLFGMDKSKLVGWQMISMNPIWLLLTFISGICAPLLIDIIIERIMKSLELAENII